VLKGGWGIRPGSRPGDLRVVRAEMPPP